MSLVSPEGGGPWYSQSQGVIMVSPTWWGVYLMSPTWWDLNVLGPRRTQCPQHQWRGDMLVSLLFPAWWERLSSGVSRLSLGGVCVCDMECPQG